MSFARPIFAVCLMFAVLIVNSSFAFAQEKGALLRGYRTGYSDGYMAGYRDSVARAKRNFAVHAEYNKANRVYRPEYGSLEDYRDGYQQGYELAYNTGYDRKEFNASLPENLTRREGGAPKLGKGKDNKTPKPDERNPPDNKPAPPSSGDATIIIPINTEIVVEMLADVNTDDNREGDKFMAKVVAPNEIGGAIIEGRIEKIKRPGRIKGNAELQLSFDRIVITEKRWTNFNATVIEALPLKNSNIKTVDSEGIVQGKSSVKKDSATVGGATVAGLTVGAIAGGPVGAAVGAAIGATAGLTGVLVARGSDINLVQGQQLRIKTNYESQIR